MQKTSVVVGGSKGIGSVISEILNKRGDRTFSLSRKNDNAFPRHIPIDLTVEKAVIQALQLLSEKVAKVDYLVFSQKFRGPNYNWKSELDLTLHATNQIINLIRNKLSTSASIVVIGSPAGKFVINEQPVEYHVSKAAIEQLTRYYAVKLGSIGVRVNCLLPGTIIKPANKKYYSGNSANRDLLEKIIPLQKMGNAEDVAELTSFLCSDKASYITGQSIFVDGGLSIVGQETIAKIVSDSANSNPEK